MRACSVSLRRLACQRLPSRMSGCLSRSRERAGSVGVVVVALVAGLVVSCSGSKGPKENLGDQLSHPVVECSRAIGVVEKPSSYYTVYGSGGGFIALPAGEMQLGRRGPADSGYQDYRFSKFGLHVRRFRQVSLDIVGTPSDAVLRFGGGSDFAPSDALTAGPCDTDGPECVIEPTEDLSVGPCGTDRGEWVVWAGGIWTNEPGCIELLASSDDERIPVWLAVGASCDRVAAKLASPSALSKPSIPRRSSHLSTTHSSKPIPISSRLRGSMHPVARPESGL